MRRWHRKLLLDTVKAGIPFQRAARRLKRRLFPYGTDPANDPYLLVQGLDQILALKREGVSVAGANVLELGSGWNPLIPLLFHLSGANSVTLTDQEQLLDKALLLNAAGFLLENREDVSRRLGLSTKEVYDRLSKIRSDVSEASSLAGALDVLNFKYRVPFDPREDPSGSVDIIVSRAVMEHIPRKTLEFFFAEFLRILKPDGTMCHIIDLSDHWEHKDKSISRVNFLKYSEFLWWFTCLNPQNYQNRLRRSEYQQMILDAGFCILSNTEILHEPSLRALETLPLADRFRLIAKNELAVVEVTFVASRRAPHKG